MKMMNFIVRTTNEMAILLKVTDIHEVTLYEQESQKIEYKVI